MSSKYPSSETPAGWATHRARFRPIRPGNFEVGSANFPIVKRDRLPKSMLDSISCLVNKIDCLVRSLIFGHFYEFAKIDVYRFKMKPSEPLEIEIKYFLEVPGRVRNRILSMGAEPLGRCFETNIRFEDDTHRLIRKRSLLRLRRDRKTILTFKSEPSETDPEFKVLTEYEVEVGDFEMMRRLLESLGFHKEQVYEKWRETFRLGGSTLCIDEMPFGPFLEIEGNRSDIRKLAADLGFSWQKRILWNYLALFEALRNRCRFPFIDITFDNFKGIHLDLNPYLHLFEAGAD